MQGSWLRRDLCWTPKKIIFTRAQSIRWRGAWGQITQGRVDLIRILLDILFVDRSHCRFRSGCAQLLSIVWLFATSWIVAHHAPLSMECSRQRYWSGLLFPSPADLPSPGIWPASLVSLALAGGFFTSEPLGKWYTNKTLSALSRRHQNGSEMDIN